MDILLNYFLNIYAYIHRVVLLSTLVRKKNVSLQQIQLMQKVTTGQGAKNKC